jgi:cephalosporin hydroxylase
MSPLPPGVDVDWRGDLRSYWLDRVGQHTQDWYAGVRMSKFPEDLRVYEHLLWESRSNAVIELGTQFGGSALWFRDRLTTLAHYGRIRSPKVISIDLDLAPARHGLRQADPGWEQHIVLLEDDVRNRALPERVASVLPSDARCLVVEDTAHVYETTRAALDGFARFVPDDGFFVVEDGCVDIDELRPSPDWPRGVLPAVDDWLRTGEGSRFAVRRDLELYGVSCHPRGFLERVRAPMGASGHERERP